MWEIRRERRMEFIFETQRLNDIRRWFKLDYMDNEKYPETMLGAWVDLPNEFPEQLDEANKDAGKSVMKEGGTVVVWNGSNQADMVGYAIPINAAARMNGLSYSKMMHGLKVANIDINRKMLAEMAVNDAQGFAALAEIAKKAIA